MKMTLILSTAQVKLLIHQDSVCCATACSEPGSTLVEVRWDRTLSHAETFWILPWSFHCSPSFLRGLLVSPSLSFSISSVRGCEEGMREDPRPEAEFRQISSFPVLSLPFCLCAPLIIPSHIFYDMPSLTGVASDHVHRR